MSLSNSDVFEAITILHFELGLLERSLKKAIEEMESGDLACLLVDLTDMKDGLREHIDSFESSVEGDTDESKTSD